MTIGDLARRTALAVKVLRRQHDMGPIYTRGRVENTGRHVLKHRLRAPKQREAAAMIGSAPAQIDEPPTRGAP
jgi:hypothetical protein